MYNGRMNEHDQSEVYGVDLYFCEGNPTSRLGKTNKSHVLYRVRGVDQDPAADISCGRPKHAERARLLVSRLMTVPQGISVADLAKQTRKFAGSVAEIKHGRVVISG